MNWMKKILAAVNWKYTGEMLLRTLVPFAVVTAFSWAVTTPREGVPYFWIYGGIIGFMAFMAVLAGYLRRRQERS